jgi:hypothetical protein
MVKCMRTYKNNGITCPNKEDVEGQRTGVGRRHQDSRDNEWVYGFISGYVCWVDKWLHCCN